MVTAGKVIVRQTSLLQVILWSVTRRDSGPGDRDDDRGCGDGGCCAHSAVTVGDRGTGQVGSSDWIQKRAYGIRPYEKRFIFVFLHNYSKQDT